MLSPRKAWVVDGAASAFLNGLRAFEAASRRGSFTAAAAELHVTQDRREPTGAAIGGALGFALFRRRANRLELTDQGRAFQPGLTEAFDAIAKLLEEAAAMRPGSVLTVGVAPAFAMRWLIPRLTRSIAATPKLRYALPLARYVSSAR